MAMAVSVFSLRRLLAFQGVREARIFLLQRFQIIGGHFPYDGVGIGDLIINLSRDRNDATAVASLDFGIGPSRFNVRRLRQGNFPALLGAQDQLFHRESGLACGCRQPHHDLHFIAASLLTQGFYAIKGSMHLSG